MDHSKSRIIAHVSFRNTGDEIIGTLPKNALEHIGNPFHLTLSIYAHSLFVYTKEAWDRLQTKIESYPSLEKQRKMRPITAFARCIHVSEDGSFVLPARLAEHAQMKACAVLCYPPKADTPHVFPEGVFLLQSEQP